MPDDPPRSASADATASPPADHERIAIIPRDQDAPLPLILLMIASMLLLVAAGFYWADRSEFGEHVLGVPTRAGNGSSITHLEEITAERVPENLLGRDVSLWDVTVAHVPGDYVFWIAAEAGRSIPVVLMGEQTGRQTEAQTRIRAGDRLAIFGTVRPIREVRLLDENWAMSRSEWASLARERTYISALRVEQLNRAP